MRPHVVVHNMVSVDGRIDWFTPDVGLYYELAGRWDAGAILTGADTICSAAEPFSEPSDEDYAPRAATPGDTRPLLAVTDSRGRVHNWHQLRQAPYWRDVIALVSPATPEDYLAHLRRLHVEYIVTGGQQVDLRAALEELNRRYGVQLVRVDSGGTLNGALLREGLVDEVSLLISPALVGGASARSMYRAPDLTTADGVVQVRLQSVETLVGDTVWLRYVVANGLP